MRRIKCLTVVAVMALSLIMAALRTVIITVRMEKNAVDNETYYLPDKPDVLLFAIVCIVLLALFAVVSFAIGKRRKICLEKPNTLVPVGSLVMAFALLFAAFIYARDVFFTEFVTYTVVGLLVFVFTVISTVKFFIAGVFDKKKFSANLRAVAIVAPIFLMVARLLGDFIRRSAVPFASSGAYLIMSVIFLMLFFLIEGKSYVSDSSAVAYYFFGFGSILLLMVHAFPNLILHCFGVFPFNYYAAFSVVDIASAVYIAFRLITAKRERIHRHKELAEITEAAAAEAEAAEI